MGTFKQLQQQRRSILSPRVSTSTLLRPSRPFALNSTATSEQTHSDWQARSDHANHFEYSFAHIPIFPPASPMSSQAVSQTGSPAIQRERLESHLSLARAEDVSTEGVRRAAQEGLQTPASKLPYAEQIQKSFGHHDVSQVQAHMGSKATASTMAMHASAYTTGDHVVFADTPGLDTVAHEAAHVVQQRNGVRIAGGIGQVGDSYEQQADAVARRVTMGQSAESLLDRLANDQQDAGNGAGKPGSEKAYVPGRTAAPGQVVQQNSWPEDKKAFLEEPTSTKFLRLLREHPEQMRGKITGIYKSRFEREYPGQFGLEVSLQTLPYVYHAHCIAVYRGQAPEEIEVREFQVQSSSLKPEEATRGVGNAAVDLRNIQMIFDKIVDIELLKRDWKREYATHYSEKHRHQEVDERHNIIHPSEDLNRWVATLKSERISDLFKTLPGLPGHVQAVQNEVSRLVNLDEFSNTQEAFQAVEDIKKSIAAAANKATFDFPIQELNFGNYGKFTFKRQNGKVTAGKA